MKIFKKAILPKGFKASGVACGIKRSGKPDLALFYSAIPAKAACLFTSSTIKAAPILLNKRYLKGSRSFEAIIVNSGNANCFTGSQGLRDAEAMSLSLARVLKTKKENILVNSTGIIGRKLPLPKIKKAIPGLVAGLARGGIAKAARAIMTTDTFSKEITVRFNIGGQAITLCGLAKGAGMIAPDMATLLVFLFTDARIRQGALNRALKTVVDNSFNCITVDGCMSTNDSVMLLSNATAGNPAISSGGNFDTFASALQAVCLELAKMVVKDAEGATKFIQIKVCGAKSFQEAKKAALAIANSSLFKAAVYGENPNFGRIVAALGAAGIDIKEKNLKMKVSHLAKKEIDVNVFLKRGESSATVYTSDLTPEYVKINAEYN
jgi:glutamate N-acetyltransferase/amino-acid N-acetyltransferase